MPPKRARSDGGALDTEDEVKAAVAAMHAASEQYKDALTKHMQGPTAIKVLRMDPLITAEVPPGFMLGQRETEIAPNVNAQLRRVDSVTLGWPDDLHLELKTTRLGGRRMGMVIAINKEYYANNLLQSDTIAALCGTGKTMFTEFNGAFAEPVTFAMFTALCKFLDATPVVNADAPFTDRSDTAVRKIALMLLACFVLDSEVYNIQQLPCVSEVPRA